MNDSNFSCWKNNRCSCCCKGIPGPAGPEGPRGERGPAGEAYKPSYAFLYENQLLQNTALLGGVSFSQYHFTPADYFVEPSTVNVFKTGLYHIIYTIFIPQGNTLDTVFRLQGNNQTLPSMVLAVRQESAWPGRSFTAQTILTLTEATVFRLSSSSIVTIRSDNVGSTLGTLAFIRLG